MTKTQNPINDQIPKANQANDRNPSAPILSSIGSWSLVVSYSKWLFSIDLSKDDSTSQPEWVISTSSSIRTPPSPGI